MSFRESWNRIAEIAGIKNQDDLAGLLKVSQAVISKYKRKDEFPVDWAYKISKKYHLFTEWIMTGEGPKGLEDINKSCNAVFKGNLAEWIKEQSEADPSFYADFSAECAAFFPAYAEWLKKRKAFLVEGRDPRQNTA